MVSQNEKQTNRNLLNDILVKEILSGLSDLRRYERGEELPMPIGDNNMYTYKIKKGCYRMLSYTNIQIDNEWKKAILHEKDEGMKSSWKNLKEYRRKDMVDIKEITNHCFDFYSSNSLIVT